MRAGSPASVLRSQSVRDGAFKRLAKHRRQPLMKASALILKSLDIFECKIFIYQGLRGLYNKCERINGSLVTLVIVGLKPRRLLVFSRQKI